MRFPNSTQRYEIDLSGAQDDIETTVIVGAGSIGLSTAYYLARAYSRVSIPARIVVVEPLDKPFDASSSHCTGCLHYCFPEKETQPLLPLGKYSFDLWAAHAKNENFRKITGYRARSCFGVNPGTGHGTESLPAWIESQPDWDVDEDVLGPHNATVNPAGIGEWLTTQCLKLGVEIETGFGVKAALLSPKNKIQAVGCLKEDLTYMRIDCSQLLLACGPWTPAVYGSLFPSSPISLQSTTNAGDWVVFKNPCPPILRTVADVSFAGIVGDKMEFAARNDGTIWACGRRNLTAKLPPSGLSAKPDEDVIEELLDRARTWLEWDCRCTEKHDVHIQLVDKGRAFRPATQSGLPVISEVQASDLTWDDFKTEHLNPSSGVFVCWGHGSYGLTLGMGTGKVMSQLMRGVKPDLDLSLFTLKKQGDVAQN